MAYEKHCKGKNKDYSMFWSAELLELFKVNKKHHDLQGKKTWLLSLAL